MLCRKKSIGRRACHGSLSLSVADSLSVTESLSVAELSAKEAALQPHSHSQSLEDRGMDVA